MKKLNKIVLLLSIIVHIQDLFAVSNLTFETYSFTRQIIAQKLLVFENESLSSKFKEALSHPIKDGLIQPLIEFFEAVSRDIDPIRPFTVLLDFEFKVPLNGLNSEYTYIMIVVDTEILPNNILIFEFPKPDHLTDWGLVFKFMKGKLHEFRISDSEMYNDVISRIHKNVILTIHEKFKASDLPYTETQLEKYLILIQHMKPLLVHSGKVHLIKIIDVLDSEDRRDHLVLLKPFLEFRLDHSLNHKNNIDIFKDSQFRSLEDGSALLIVGGRSDYISIDALPKNLPEEKALSLMHEIYVLCAENNFTPDERNSLMNHILKRSVLNTHE